ncbi:MAG: hypothetical protein AAB279_02715, partial [Candidatus Binatota bacterium]
DLAAVVGFPLAGACADAGDASGLVVAGGGQPLNTRKKKNINPESAALSRSAISFSFREVIGIYTKLLFIISATGMSI